MVREVPGLGRDEGEVKGGGKGAGGILGGRGGKE